MGPPAARRPAPKRASTRCKRTRSPSGQPSREPSQPAISSAVAGRGVPRRLPSPMNCRVAVTASPTAQDIPVASTMDGAGDYVFIERTGTNEEPVALRAPCGAPEPSCLVPFPHKTYPPDSVSSLLSREIVGKEKASIVRLCSGGSDVVLDSLKHEGGTHELAVFRGVQPVE